MLDVVIGVLFGAAAGSFLGCCLYRLPRRLSLMGRSFCPSCGTELKGRWNIPVLSWIAFRGRSRCCRAPISLTYLLSELAACVVGAALALVAGWEVVVATTLGLIFVAVGVSLATRNGKLN